MIEKEVYLIMKMNNTNPWSLGSIIFVVGKSPIDIMEPILL